MTVQTKANQTDVLYMSEQQNGSASMFVNTDAIIVQSPEIRGGRPRVVGTGVTVERIVGWYKLGLSPEDIVERIEHLSLAQIYAALTYYHLNRGEIEESIAKTEAEADRLEKEYLAAAQVHESL